MDAQNLAKSWVLQTGIAHKNEIVRTELEPHDLKATGSARY